MPIHECSIMPVFVHESITPNGKHVCVVHYSQMIAPKKNDVTGYKFNFVFPVTKERIFENANGFLSLNTMNNAKFKVKAPLNCALKVLATDHRDLLTEKMNDHNLVCNIPEGIDFSFTPAINAWQRSLVFSVTFSSEILTSSKTKEDKMKLIVKSGLWKDFKNVCNSDKMGFSKIRILNVEDEDAHLMIHTELLKTNFRWSKDDSKDIDGMVEKFLSTPFEENAIKFVVNALEAQPTKSGDSFNELCLSDQVAVCTIARDFHFINVLKFVALTVKINRENLIPLSEFRELYKPIAKFYTANSSNKEFQLKNINRGILEEIIIELHKKT